ncbi:MAG: PIN domain-containing protein [Anaerolineales bacterium]|nr:PIN domain-containing protein [Chloroflexota bacterium]MBL6983701.1 PIN domain-containing protein [Anaerolineales bacterium]
MTKRNRRIFLDTSDIFAAALSATGGARKLFRLGEAGVIQLIVGPNVLRECEAVIRRKMPESLPTLAYLLELGLVEVAIQSQENYVEHASTIIAYKPDAHVLAEALSIQPDWFITHDKHHFLSHRQNLELTFRIGTPGDLIQALEDEFTNL